MNEPTKPGHWYGRIDGEETIILVDEIMVCQSYCGMTFNPNNSCVEWHNEPVPTMVEARELRQQVEFLEWMCKIPTRSVVGVSKTKDGRRLFNLVSNKEVRWPGELRDGWKHWDKIKGAIK